MTAHGGSMPSQLGREPRAPLSRVCALGAVALSGVLLRWGGAFVSPAPRNQCIRCVELQARGARGRDNLGLYDEVIEDDLDESLDDEAWDGDLDELTLDEIDMVGSDFDRRGDGRGMQRPAHQWQRTPGEEELDPNFRRERYFGRADFDGNGRGMRRPARQWRGPPGEELDPESRRERYFDRRFDRDGRGMRRPARRGQRPPGEVELDPKFRREGYFDRADLPRLDPTEFDKRGVLQTLSVEELEARTQFRWGLDSKQNDRHKPELFEEQGEEEQTELRWAPDPRRQYNPFESRPLRGRMRKPRVQVEAPAPEARRPEARRPEARRPEARRPEARRPEVQARRAPALTPTASSFPRVVNKTTKKVAKSLDSWLLNTKVPLREKEQRSAENLQTRSGQKPDDRVGSSTYRKMYKAVLRNYGSLPWERVEGQTSWLDPANESWEELGMNSPETQTVIELLRDFGVQTPNRLQSLALPAILTGKDVMLTSTTGSGKTLAFLLPLLHRSVFPLSREDLRRYRSNLPHHLAPKILSKPQILVVAPGRELSKQTARVINDLLKPFPQLNVTMLVGKDNHKRQDEQLAERQPVVVVGTPGKLMDHTMEGRLILRDLEAIVFDEVDALLSMSRKDHLQLLLQHIGVNENAQRILVSASGSMEGDAIGFAESILRDGWKLVGPKYGMELPKRVLHLVNGAPDADKKLAFLRRLSASDPPANSFIVFCNNHERVRKVAEQMNQLGIVSEYLTGNRSKEARDRAIYSVAEGQVQALVATDAAMRGLDFRELTHVVNFELPGDAATYAHRAGRCGRMGFNGIVISLASGGYENKRLRSYANILNFELIEANVNEGVLGADMNMLYSPGTGIRKRRKRF